LKRGRGLLALALTALGGCDTDSGAGASLSLAADVAPAERAPVEVFNWGGLPNDVLAEHERRHPEDEVIHANAQLSGTARKVLRARLLAGEPPDTFQANAGFDLMQWVLFNQANVRESKLHSLEGLPELAEARRAFPPALLEALSSDGQMYAVPANVHRINDVFFNPAVLRLVHAEPPQSLDEMFVLAERLKRRGIPLLAVGSKDPWTLSILIVETLLVAQHGADFYSDYFSGELAADDPRMLHTLRTALRLLEYANPDRNELYWQQAAEMVFDGKAAMTVIGDWARTAFDDRPGADESYREMAFPGSESVFVYTCNVFPIPIGAKNEAGVRRLLSTIASKDGQSAIGRSKTSIPARTDVSVSDESQAKKQQLWRQGRLVLAQSGFVPARFSGDLSQALQDLDRERRLSPVLYTLRARYPLLGR
jgi:glucose/mannose transport system substrate-binding protein